MQLLNNPVAIMGCGSSKSAQTTVTPISTNMTTNKEPELHNTCVEVEESKETFNTATSPRRYSDVTESLYVNRQKRAHETNEESLIGKDGWLGGDVHQLTSSSSDFKFEPEKKTLQNVTEYLSTFDIDDVKHDLTQSIQDVSIHPQLAADENSSSEVAEVSTNIAETEYTCNRFDSIWGYLCEDISSHARYLAAIQHGDPLSITWRHSSPANVNLIQLWISIASIIEEFDLSENFIGPEGFRTLLLALSYLKNLKSVKISSNKTDKSCSASIKRFLSSSSHLEKLDISCNNLSGGSFGRDLVQGLEQTPNLVSLNLSGCGLVDIEPLLEIDSQSQFVKTIRHLDLSHNPINSQLFSISIRTFMSKVRLEELNLNSCDLSSYAMSCFVSSLFDNSTILKLNTSANKFSGKAGLLQLVTVCMLQEFICELIACNVIYKESQEIRESQNQLANLIKDKIEGVNVNSSLKKLFLSNCDIDPPFLKLLRTNMITTEVQLSDIDLSSNSGCTTEEFRLFAWGADSEQNILSQLETLTGGSHMGDDIIRLIRDDTFPILKRLSLIRSKIGPNRVGNLSEYICKVITSDTESTSSEVPQLTDLVLDGIKLSGTNRSAIVNLFNAITFLQHTTAKVNWSLTRLSLNSCSLNDSDIKPISNALSHGLSLEYLSLACNRLGDNALVDLVAGLKCCNTLRTIDLANNSLGSKGVTALADCLSRLQVERILVSGNLIGGDGVLALLNLTRMCAGMSLLDLRNQKAEFSDQYLDLVYSSVKGIIESRVSAGNSKSLVVIKLSGVGEQLSQHWQSIDSHYVETNCRKHKLINVGMWDALALLYSFKLASNPKLNYIREYESSNKRTCQGVGEVGLFEDEWKEVVGSSTQVPSWLLVEFHRERGVFVSGLSVAVTQNRLEGILETEADCHVVEVVMCKDPVGNANGSAWVLFEDRNSVDNAIEYYNNGFACLYGEPFIITPLAVRILDREANGEHLELVRADISQRAEEHAEEKREHRELIEQKCEESQERQGKLLANSAHQGGRFW